MHANCRRLDVKQEDRIQKLLIDKTAVIRLNAKRESINMIPAITNQG